MSIDKPKKIKAMPLGGIKVLKALEYPERLEGMMLEYPEQRILKSYKELKEETKLSDPVISGYLKSLQKEKLIERDIDTRKYYLTRKGMAKLKRRHTITRLSHFLYELEQTTKTWVQSRPYANVEEVREKIKSLHDNLYENLKNFLTSSSKDSLDGITSLDQLLRSYADLLLFFSKHRLPNMSEIDEILRERRE